MATLTSTRSGYWSDSTLWDIRRTPQEGDTVVIANGHTVKYDYDMSSFLDGIHSLIVNGTLFIPDRREDPNIPNGVLLKVLRNVVGSGTFQIGSSSYPMDITVGRIIVGRGIQVSSLLIYTSDNRKVYLNILESPSTVIQIDDVVTLTIQE